MSISNPSFYMILNEADGSMNTLVSSLFKIPFDFGKLALVSKFSWEGFWLYSIVQIWAVLGRCELQKKFTDFIVDFVIFKDLKIRDSITCLFNQYLAEVVEGVKAILLEAFINVFKDLCKLKIKNRGIKLESDKIISFKCIHTFKGFLLMNKWGKDDF